MDWRSATSEMGSEAATDVNSDRLCPLFDRALRCGGGAALALFAIDALFVEYI